MSAFLGPLLLLRVGSAGWPVLKAAGDQEYIVIRKFAAKNGHLHNFLKALIRSLLLFLFASTSAMSWAVDALANILETLLLLLISGKRNASIDSNYLRAV